MIGAKLKRAFVSCEYSAVPRPLPALCAATAVALLIVLTGCRTPSEHRLDADKVAADIIQQKQMQALGQTQQFSVERPSDILRRRLLLDQNLPYASQASLGTDKLKTIEHWPENDYPKAEPSLDSVLPLETNKPPQLSLVQALQIGARNSFEYQTLKENIFQVALDLDLKRNEFRNIFAGQY